jgi:hypothetical protein
MLAESGAANLSTRAVFEQGLPLPQLRRVYNNNK